MTLQLCAQTLRTVVKEYYIRAEMEYRDHNPRPDNYPAFLEKMRTLWSSQPKWNAASFAKIPTLFNKPRSALDLDSWCGP
jgi:hypothetical protein